MNPKPDPTRADDIETLKESLDLPGLPYVDFAAEYELREVYRRWPALREIHQENAEDGP